MRKKPSKIRDGVPYHVDLGPKRASSALLGGLSVPHQLTRPADLGACRRNYALLTCHATAMRRCGNMHVEVLFIVRPSQRSDVSELMLEEFERSPESASCSERQWCSHPCP